MRTKYIDEDAHIPSVIVDGKILVRGTEAWDDRESLRQMAGCRLIGFGSIVKSENTRGTSSAMRYLLWKT